MRKSVGKDEIPNIWKVIEFHGSSHHQPVMIPSGKRLHNELEHHHAINGKTHYI